MKKTVDCTNEKAGNKKRRGDDEAPYSREGLRGKGNDKRDQDRKQSPPKPDR